MANLSKMYKELLSDLEKSVKDEKELESIKQKVSDIITTFVDSINNLIDMQERHEKLDKDLSNVIKRVERIEDDIYIEDDEEDIDDHDQMHDNDYEFEIRCPYCDEDFIINDGAKNSIEIECPKCHNIIELDWDEDAECSGHCNKCKDHCYQEDDEEDSNNEEKIAESEEEYNLEDKEEPKEEEDKKDNKKQDNNKNNEDDM